MLTGVHLAEADLRDLPVAAHLSAEEILAHPRFPFARQAYVDAILAIYEHDPFLSRLLLETGRTVLFIGIMYLHARHDRAGRATWPTPRIITEQTVAHGVASPRRVHDLVWRFISTGYLARRAVPQDRRVCVLMPTQRMIAHDQDVLASHYLPLQILYPQPGYRPIIERDPAFQLRQRCVSANLLARGARIVADDPVMRPFLRRDAGVMILLKLMQMVGPMGEATPFELSFSDIGIRIGVSRTHVRNLLEEAERQGLVRLSRGASRFAEPRPALMRAFDRFVAESMVAHDLIYNLALARGVDMTQTEKTEGLGCECLDAAHSAENHRPTLTFA